MRSQFAVRALWCCPVDGCGYVIRTDLPWSEAVSAVVTEAADRRGAELEARLREHAESHDLMDFLRTIQRLQMDLAQQDSGGPSAPLQQSAQHHLSTVPADLSPSDRCREGVLRGVSRLDVSPDSRLSGNRRAGAH